VLVHFDEDPVQPAPAACAPACPLGAPAHPPALGLYSPAMAKVCHVCRKGPAFGNTRSHSMVATRRRFDPNLQRVRIDDNGTPRRVYVCTRCLKAGKVAKAK
jgi:large subunit ribosomal protein L28